ncbi:MAG: polymer-forming cytoskeletal protein, partial [Stellaceae bacterium]
TVAPLGRSPASMPPRVPDQPRPAPLGAPESVRPAEAAAVRPAMPLGGAGGSRLPEGDARKLIVGREISLSGEITSCDKLIVEGSVEANLQNCHEVEITESGLFKGTASIDEAEVRGRFEGDLSVRRRLFIRASGKVSGSIRYGQLEVEAGGQLSGDIQAQGDDIVDLPGARATY